MIIDKTEITCLTEEYGGSWGINHTRRLLHLVASISEGQNYNEDAVWVAAHLHDWGAYPKWAEKDVDHAVKSVEVAKNFLTERNFPVDVTELVLQCIRVHHSGSPDMGIESILLFDADALDFLGVVGILRDFSKNPKELRKAFEITQKRREKLPSQLILQKSREIASVRIAEMDKIFAVFEEESFGFF